MTKNERKKEESNYFLINLKWNLIDLFGKRAYYWLLEERKKERRKKKGLDLYIFNKFKVAINKILIFSTKNNKF